MTIDDTFSETGLVDLGRDFQGLDQKQFTTEVLPTTPQVVNDSDVLEEAQPYGAAMIKKFLAFGTSAQSSTTKGPAPLAPTSIRVRVLNGSGVALVADQASQELHGLGYKLAGTGNAKNFGYTTNEIEYGLKGSAAAHRLGASLVDGATLVEDTALSGSTVDLIVGSYWDGVESNTVSSSPTTTIPGESGTTGTTPAGDVVFDNPQTLPEPWDPTTCSG
jgi:hypothetical protein